MLTISETSLVRSFYCCCIINLELIYPFLNALGLLTMVITGLLMWLRSPSRRKKIQALQELPW